MPTIQEVGPELANQDPEQQFEYGLNVVLAGLEALLPRR
jgi:hypothetical protein